MPEGPTKRRVLNQRQCCISEPMFTAPTVVTLSVAPLPMFTARPLLLARVPWDDRRAGQIQDVRTPAEINIAQDGARLNIERVGPGAKL